MVVWVHLHVLCASSCAPQEHCLVGVRGNRVQRSKDHAFVHANCDTDIICSEEPPLGSTEKPEELYNIIERFCNGRCAIDYIASVILSRAA